MAGCSPQPVAHASIVVFFRFLVFIRLAVCRRARIPHPRCQSQRARHRPGAGVRVRTWRVCRRFVEQPVGARPASALSGHPSASGKAAAARARDFIASFGVLPRGGQALRDACFKILTEAVLATPACIHEALQPGKPVVVEDVARALAERMGSNLMSKGAWEQFHLAVGMMRGALGGAAASAPDPVEADRAE